MWWYLLLFLIGRCEVRTKEIQCFAGSDMFKDVYLEEVSSGNRKCMVRPTSGGKGFTFDVHTCDHEGCHYESGFEATVCCCSTNKCNTISFYKLESSSPSPLMFIGHCVILLIIIAKLLTLLIINIGCCWRFEGKYQGRIHVDLTELVVQPRMNNVELNYIIDSFSKEINHLSANPLTSLEMRSVLTYSTSDKITYREARDQAKLNGVDKGSKMKDILSAVVRLGPCEIDYDGDVMIAILKEAYNTLSKEPTLLELSAPIVVYGDIHGQYSDIWRWFHVNGWPPETRCLFLGDYVDRGRHSTEVFMFVLLLKVVLSKSVFLIRGNHEEPIVNKTYNFYSELKARFPRKFRKIYGKVEDVYSVLPIACLIGEQIICMHGGLSPKIHTVNEIAAIQKPLYKRSKPGAHIDLMWSDPLPSQWTFQPNTLRDPAGVGVGFLFGPIQIRKFINKNQLSLIVRGHQPPMSGYERIGKYLLTIFSTPGYRVQNDICNMGASLLIDEDGTMDVIRIQAAESLKIKRQRYKMDKGDSYRDCGKPKIKKQQPSADEKYS